MADVHPTALVDSRAVLGEGVEIGPYAIVRGPVTVGRHVLIDAYSIVEGPAEIGDGVRIGPAAFVGTPPQHRTHDPSIETWLVVGAGTIIREGVSLHRATQPGRERATRVGENCYLMGNSHVGHDCVLGDNVTVANSALLGGFVTVGDSAFLSGGSVYHQYVRIGRLAMVAGLEAVSHDVPPFAAVRYGGLKGYNAVGCRRSGMSRESIHAIRQVFHCLQAHRVLSEATAAIRARVPMTVEVTELLAFIARTRRGIAPAVTRRSIPSRGGGAMDDE